MSKFLKRIMIILVALGVGFGFVQINKTYGFEYGVYYMLMLLILSNSNSFIRLYSWSKPIVSSKFNFFTTKYEKKLIVNLPPEIAYGKFIEVIKNSNLILKTSDDKTLEIFTYKKVSWFSRGENMYISFEKSGDSSRMNVLSVSFKVFNEEANHKTLIDLINEFENSLTI